MNPDSPELTRLLQKVPGARLQDLLRITGINETPPWTRGSYQFGEVEKWTARHRSKLISFIARFSYIPNNAVTELFGDELQRLATTSPNRRGNLTFVPRRGNPTQPLADEIPLQLVTASAAIFFQLYADICGAGQSTDPPPPPWGS